MPKRTEYALTLRVAGSLHARLEQSARDNHRTLTAEIVHRLEQTYAGPALVAELRTAVREEVGELFLEYLRAGRVAREMSEVGQPSKGSKP
jgi:hypothetical protein